LAALLEVAEAVAVVRMSGRSLVNKLMNLELRSEAVVVCTRNFLQSIDPLVAFPSWHTVAIEALLAWAVQMEAEPSQDD
jgi:hypothetical protein